MNFSWDSAAPGLSQAFKSLAGDPYGKGQAAQVALESKIAQALWQAEQSKSAIAANDARTAETNAKTANITGRAGVIEQIMANIAGMGVPQFSEARGRVQQGLPAQVEDNGVQNVIVPGADQKITNALRQGLPMLSDPNANVQQIAAAAGLYGDQDRMSGMLSGAINPETVRQAQLAEKGGNRYGVDGDMSVDQFVGVGAPTAIGRSRIAVNDSAITENLARATKAGADNARGRFVIKETDTGFVRVPVEGEAGAIDLGGAMPRGRRDTQLADLRSEYTVMYGNDPLLRPRNAPTFDQFVASKKTGTVRPQGGAVDPAQTRAAAQAAIARGKDPAAVARRFKELTGQDL